ncbi:UNVERIFIED_CONTAM: hypothetical protein NCL1_62199 [Trichonephila clavipes]
MRLAEGQQFKRAESDRSGKRTKHQRIMRMGEMRREWIYKGSEKVRRGIGVLEGAVLKPLAAIKDCVLEGAVRRTFLCVRARYKKNCPSQDCDLFIPVEIKDRRRKKGCCYEGEFFKRRKKRRSLPRCASR